MGYLLSCNENFAFHLNSNNIAYCLCHFNTVVYTLFIIIIPDVSSLPITKSEKMIISQATYQSYIFS